MEREKDEEGPKASSAWSHQQRMDEMKRLWEKMLKAKQAWRFMEDEAELGSDNEDNDDIRKAINWNDEDEIDGDDLDQDLKELINNEQVDGEEENALAKFMNDQKDEDRELFKQAYQLAMG